MSKNIILTGAMGSGKSTVLQLLKAQNCKVVPEPAREILAEQRSIGEEGIPEKNPKLFTQLLLSRAIYQYKQMHNTHHVVFFDRGIPDNIAYAKLFNLDYSPAYKAAEIYRYNVDVFVFPAWHEIYTPDDERKLSFEIAKSFGDDLQNIYQELGYNLIEVPYVSPEERTKFIIEKTHRDNR